MAAIENDNSYASIANKRQLEEQLAEAQEKLEEKQYQHSVTAAEKALDQQAAAYEEAKNVEIERLQEKLKDVDALFKEATAGLNGHMAEAMESITTTLSEYGVKMSDIISNAIIKGIETGSTAVNEFFNGIAANQNDYTARTEQAIADQEVAEKKKSFEQAMAGTYAGDLKSMINQLEKANIINSKQHDKWISAAKGTGEKFSLNNISNNISKGDYANAASLITELIKDVKSKKNGKSEKQQKKLEKFIEALRDWRTKVKGGYQNYATGVHKLKKDEIAWTQEYGREAILSPTRNAVLTPLKAGDSVLTKDQTENLFRLAKNPVTYLKELSDFDHIKLASVNGGIVMNIDNILTVQGDVNDSNAKEMSEIAQKAITKAFNEFSSRIKK